MLLPYKSRHLLRKKSGFFARTGRSVIQFYNKLAAVYWLPMFWPRRRPGTHGTHFVSMSGPTVHPYTVIQRTMSNRALTEAEANNWNDKISFIFLKYTVAARRQM